MVAVTSCASTPEVAIIVNVTMATYLTLSQRNAFVSHKVIIIF